MQIFISLPPQNISIHALRGEGDHFKAGTSNASCNFNPRPPWGGRHSNMEKIWNEAKISIHALRGEGDVMESALVFSSLYFNPRPPWGGRRETYCAECKPERFQSTPSVGRAMIRGWVFCIKCQISIHALRGEGDLSLKYEKLDQGIISIHALRGEGDLEAIVNEIDPTAISIHALRGEGDLTKLCLFEYGVLFQSTPSVGRATVYSQNG